MPNIELHIKRLVKLKGLLFYIFLIIITSCDTQKIIFSGPYFIRFTNIAQTEKESNSKVIKIELHNAGPKLSEDILVSYAISGDAREGVDYNIVGTRGQVIIKANSYFGYIEVQLMNNANNILRSQDIIFTLITTSGGLVVGQGEGGIGKKFTLSILDDCILGGIYNGSQNAFTVPTKGIEITSSDCEKYLLSNWDVGVFNAADPVPLNFIDNGDNSLTIPKQQTQAFFGFGTYDFDVEGVGSVNPLTREIFLSITYTDVDTGTEYSASITLQPE